MLFRILLFFSSYAPLFLLFAVRFDCWWYRGPALGIGVIGALIPGLLLLYHSNDQPHSISPVKIREAGSEAASYLGSYLLPFLVPGSPSGREITMYVGFLVIVAIVFVRSSTIQVNPTLFFWWYKVAQIETKQGNTYYVIYRGHLYLSHPASLVDIDSGWKFAPKKLQ